MTRTDLLNDVIRRTGAVSYLEIGIRNPADNFDRIQCLQRTGIDPANRNAMAHGWRIVRLTSAEYALSHPPPYDVIFVDGDHRYAGVRDDIAAYAPLARCALVCHDCWPGRGESTAPEKPDGGGPWSGGAWRAWSEWCCTIGPWQRYLCLDNHGLGIAIRQPDDIDPLHGEYPLDLADWLTSWRNWCEPWR